MGRIIGVMGQARAGKDTIAKYLAEKHNCVRIGLADVMKRFCQEIFRFDDYQVWGDGKEELDSRYMRPTPGKETTFLTPRYALQTLGTEWGRQCYPNVWIDYGVRTANTLLFERAPNGKFYGYTPKQGLFWAKEEDDDWPRADGVVFSDLRFRNEFKAVRYDDGILVRVKRPGADGQVGIGHPSEEEQKKIPDKDFDLILDNNGELEDLYRKIEERLVPLFKEKT